MTLQNEVSWTAAPLESLMDVDSIVDGWRAKGMTVHKVRGPLMPGCGLSGAVRSARIAVSCLLHRLPLSGHRPFSRSRATRLMCERRLRVAYIIL